MAEIIDFNRLFKESHSDSQEDSQQEHQPQNLSIPKGAYVKLIGKIKDDVLRNDVMLPVVPKEQQNQMLEYHSRYAIAQGIDEIMKRICQGILLLSLSTLKKWFMKRILTKTS